MPWLPSSKAGTIAPFFEGVDNLFLGQQRELPPEYDKLLYQNKS
jgi:hypothetical protein